LAESISCDILISNSRLATVHSLQCSQPQVEGVWLKAESFRFERTFPSAQLMFDGSCPVAYMIYSWLKRLLLPSTLIPFPSPFSHQSPYEVLANPTTCCV